MELRTVTKLDKRNETTSKKKKKKKKKLTILHLGKLWRYFYFFNLQPLCSNPEAGFRL